MVGVTSDGATGDALTSAFDDRPPLADTAGYLHAPGFSMSTGADNGTGGAVCNRLLLDPDVPHGEIEILMTNREESGFGSLRGVAHPEIAELTGPLAAMGVTVQSEPIRTRGELLISTECTRDGDAWLGAQGLRFYSASSDRATEPVPEGWSGVRVQLGGLLGGHSGFNIHEDRRNALVALARAFPGEVRIVGFSGGDRFNAIPITAEATVALPPGSALTPEAIEAALREALLSEGSMEDPARLTLSIQPEALAAGTQALTPGGGADARCPLHDVRARRPRHAGGPAPRGRDDERAARAAGLLLTPLVDFVTSIGQSPRVELARTELRALVARLTGQGLLSRERRLHKRLYTSVLSGQIQLSPSRDGDGPGDFRTRYYLDPWNNPVWVISIRSAVALYSFGPNRRRDGEAEDYARGVAPAGDDIAVVVIVSQSSPSASVPASLDPGGASK